MPPDPGVALDGETRACLRRAAALAGDPAVLPELERLLTSYLARRGMVAAGETTSAVRDRLADKARVLARARRDAELLTPGDRLILGDAAEVDRLAGAAADALSALEQRMADIAAALAERPGRRADRAPGSPRWRLLWAAAGIWSGAGYPVGIGSATAFHEFAAELLHAAGEEAPERVVVEVARTWRARAPA